MTDQDQANAGVPPEAQPAPQGTLSGANLAASADSDAGPGGTVREAEGAAAPSGDTPAQWKYPGDEGYEEAVEAAKPQEAAEPTA